MSLLFHASLIVASAPIALFIYSVNQTSTYAVAFMLELLIKATVCGSLAHAEKLSLDKAFTFQAEVIALSYSRRLFRLWQ